MNPNAAETEISRHKCLVYEGHPSSQLSVVVPFLEQGLQDRWRCLYLGSPEMVSMTNSALIDRGIDTGFQIRSTALILSSDRGHLSGGKFTPSQMVHAISEEIDHAVEDGFHGLCATGDMRWELGDDQNFDLLLEYEALLEQLFRDKPLRGICQYHRDVLPPRAVRDALLTHQNAYIGDGLNRENWFYIPPELLLNKEEGSVAKHGEWMCQQIVRVQSAERKRDSALKALQESESQLRRLAEQLVETNRDLDLRVSERTTELRLANEHLESFSYTVCHDLRSPLTAITGSAEMLAEDCKRVLGDEGLQHVLRITNSAQKMNELIEGLLTLARISRADLRRTSVDLTELASEVALELSEADPSRSVTWVIDPELESEGDGVLVRAVLANLLGNAWKFTSKVPHARIEIGSVAGQNQPVFFVRDNGAGFEMKYADRLFSAFQRLHGQKEFPGTGIGLATVHKIISKHGGEIWAESRFNEGATFFFTLGRSEASPPHHPSDSPKLAP